MMQRLAALGLLLVAGCAAPYGGTSVLSPPPPNLSTMRQITGRADGLETLQPEPGDIWAAEPPAKTPSLQPPGRPRSVRAAAPEAGSPLFPPPLSHAEGDFRQTAELTDCLRMAWQGVGWMIQARDVDPRDAPPDGRACPQDQALPV